MYKSALLVLSMILAFALSMPTLSEGATKDGKNTTQREFVGHTGVIAAHENFVKGNVGVARMNALCDVAMADPLINVLGAKMCTTEEIQNSTIPLFDERLGITWSLPDGAWVRPVITMVLPDGRLLDASGTSEYISGKRQHVMLRVERGVEVG